MARRMRPVAPSPGVVAGGSITSGEGSLGGAAKGVGRGCNAEVREDERRDVDDAAGGAVDADREQRHLAVAGNERAVRAAADVIAAAEISELEALCRGDQHLTGVRVRERSPG